MLTSPQRRSTAPRCSCGRLLQRLSGSAKTDEEGILTGPGAHAGNKEGAVKAWKEGRLVIPEDTRPGQLSSRAVDHKAWARAATNSYEVDYEEVTATAQDATGLKKGQCVRPLMMSWSFPDP